MTAFVVFLAFLALIVLAGVVSARDMRPQRRPPEWSVGGLMQSRH